MRRTHSHRTDHETVWGFQLWIRVSRNRRHDVEHCEHRELLWCNETLEARPFGYLGLSSDGLHQILAINIQTVRQSGNGVDTSECSDGLQETSIPLSPTTPPRRAMSRSYRNPSKGQVRLFGNARRDQPHSALALRAWLGGSRAGVETMPVRSRYSPPCRASIRDGTRAQVRRNSESQDGGSPSRRLLESQQSTW